MRPALIAGNWKMHLLRQEAEAHVSTLRSGLARVPAGRELLIIPPFTLLVSLAECLQGTGIALGGQDLHWESSGAFTSGISGPMLRDAGCTYVLVGHSERRDHFGDRGEVLRRKLRAALAARLRPIYCMGEHLAEREAGQTAALLGTQFDEVLGGLSCAEMAEVELAYEPVWAIGTGRTATPELAQDAHALLRGQLRAEFGSDTASACRILYGGSVKPENASGLLSMRDVDGLLVGGASLSADSFLGIAGAA